MNMSGSAPWAYSGTGRDTEEGTFRPQLTSLVDVMTILLVFLIKSFSVEGNIVTPSADLQLPVSSAEKPARPACTIEISRTEVASEGTVIVPVAEFARADSLVIPALYDWMLFQKSKGNDTSGAGKVLIQADRDLEFNIVKRVMYTCSKAGFSDFSVLVLQEE